MRERKEREKERQREKGLAQKSSSFSVIGSKYFGIFFMNFIPKTDKNPDLMVKNSSLYKLKLIVAIHEREREKEKERKK